MISTIFLVISLLLAISFHEAAHAYAADRLGDPTAKYAGRLTLNPLAHLDPLGTLALIFVHIGWGKPVPVNPNNLKHPSWYNFLIALAGPSTNIALALVAAFILHFTASIAGLSDFLAAFIALNLVLMIFNLIPIPPLDGSKIWHLVLSNENYYALERMGPVILLAVLVFSFSFGGFLTNFVGNATNYIYNLIT